MTAETKATDRLVECPRCHKRIAVGTASESPLPIGVVFGCASCGALLMLDTEDRAIAVQGKRA